jgi:aminopeptidase N
VASYFKEFSFKNSTLDDFLRHMGNASKEMKMEQDFVKWAYTWLKTAGCNQIWHDVEEEGGKIKKFTVQ